ncbi:glutaminyl-peptide cyclotransferase [Actinophytocola sp.]|uniref:glutaminyl-peptide cyclotransferase n=1 Tax=Actinophytocola sp. TaxID=1872138 RepID=UPI002D7F43A0|nr:glutaminyl-peptide cyclotransferase [Actinophytocola sp.]HET9139603.1 glutaminyl-peptide cyclotransferase [Actinophytocola sp.]
MTTLVRVLVVCAALLAGCGTAAPAPAPTAPAGEPQRLRAEVLGEIPHDTKAFTQGLEIADGTLYEGTGLKGRSSMRALDPVTGAVRQQTALPADLFGEGITVAGPSIWQITWQNGVAIERDRATLAERRRVDYPGEGWGICLDRSANRLVMSDGSDRLTFRDPQTFQPLGEVRVTSNGQPVTQLNELECAQGAVFANVWKTDEIVRIDPATGQVTAEVDLANLLTEEERGSADVLNGIAAIPGTDEFLVTGKYWPKMFRVKFVP